MSAKLRCFALTACVLALPACTTSYQSLYKQTGRSTAGPIAADQVKVVRSRDDLVQSWAEIGAYRGHAPTTREAMEAAQRECGRNGANLFILNTDPFASEHVWKVDGICAIGPH